MCGAHSSNSSAEREDKAGDESGRRSTGNDIL